MSEADKQPGERTPVISIIGLGRTGVALGLALQRVKTRFEILGHDRDVERARPAVEAGAIDRASWNLIEVAEAGDLVFLTEPVGELCETLETIAPHLRPGTLVTDTASTKARVLRVAERALPEEVSFIGGHPVLGPAAGAEPDATMFEGTPYCLVPLASASDDAMRVLGNLVAAIGAQPYFIDALEHDALMAGVRHTPYLMWAALMRVVDRSPSVEDLQRLSGPAWPAAAMAVEDAGDMRAAVLSNAAGVVRWLDQVVGGLLELREVLEAGDEERLTELLGAAEEAGRRWEYPGRDIAEPDPVLSELRRQDMLRDMLLGRLGRRRDD